MMDFLELAGRRYSCKDFSSRPLEREVLARILEAGRLAPTAKNLQEQRVYVIESDEALRTVDGITPCRYGAPTVLLVAFDRNNVFTYPGGRRDSGVEDASIVATHLMLAAAQRAWTAAGSTSSTRTRRKRHSISPRTRKSSCSSTWAMHRRAQARLPTTRAARASTRLSSDSSQAFLSIPIR